MKASHEGAGSAPNHPLNSRDLFSTVILMLVALTMFANTLHGDFVYDDLRQVVRNPLIQQPSLGIQALTSDVWAFKGDGDTTASNYWRPTFTALNILNFQLFGSATWGWHLVNILLHMLVTLCVFLLLRQWRQSRLMALAVALVFAVHPVHSESVAWIAGSPDLLLSLSLLSTLLLVGRYTKTSNRTVLLAALGTYGLALGSKEVALLCLPLIWWVLWWTFRRHEDSRGVSPPKQRIPTACVLFLVVAISYFFARIQVLGAVSMPQPNSVGPLEAALTAPKAFLFYLKQIILPLELSPGYPLRPVFSPTVTQFWLPLLLSVLFFAGAFRLAKRYDLAKVGLLIFVLPLAPAFLINNFPRDQIVHDRYLYLPLLGFLMLIAPGLQSILRKISGDATLERSVASVAVLLLALALGIKTYSYNEAWSTERTLWEHALKVDASSAFHWSQYGAALAAEDRHQQALTAFDRAAEIQETPRVLLGRGRALTEVGRPSDAIAVLTTLVATPPADIDIYALYQGYEALAVAQMAAGGEAATARAGATLVEARSRLPMYFAALTEKISVILYLEGRKAEALQALLVAEERASRELLPESKAVFLRIGLLQAEAGQRGAAITSLEKFLQATVNYTSDSMVQQRKTASDELARLEQAP